MRSIMIVFALASASCGSGDETEAATARQCEQLRDHLVELRLQGTNLDVAAHRAAIRQSLGDDFVGTCTAQMTRDQIRCALAASDAPDALECTRDTSGPAAIHATDEGE